MGSFVVTGSSSGLGRAITVALLKQGHRVFAGVRTEGDEAALRTEGAEPLRLDVTDDASVKAAVPRLGTSLDGLVNCAGVALLGPMEWTSTEQLRDALEVNVLGVHRVTVALMPLLRQGRGRLVNVSSMSGLLVPPFVGAYAATKFALEGMSDAWRLELAPFGVHVAVVEPSALATPMWTRLLAALDTVKGSAPYPEWDVARLRLAQAGRAGEPVTKTVERVVDALLGPAPQARYPDEDVSALRAMPDLERDGLLRRAWGLSSR